jgi:G3E family GTPase
MHRVLPEMELIPTILLTGFLGAGKTTLLNRLIPFYRVQRLALLINEFGKVGVDGELLIPGDYAKLELNRGSLFCVCVRTDFIAAVGQIGLQLKPDLLIIEATGIADTSEMERMLAVPTLRQWIRLEAVLCLVDATSFLKIKDNLKAPAAQIRSADLVLLNKIDLAGESQIVRIEAAIRAISPQARIQRTQRAEFPLDLLSQIQRPVIETMASPGDGFPDPVFSHTMEFAGNISRERLERLMASLNAGILRVKGFVRIDGVWQYLDKSGEIWSLTPVATSSIAINRIVVIGGNLEPLQLTKRFQECLLC